MPVKYCQQPSENNKNLGKCTKLYIFWPPRTILFFYYLFNYVLFGPWNVGIQEDNWRKDDVGNTDDFSEWTEELSRERFDKFMKSPGAIDVVNICEVAWTKNEPEFSVEVEVAIRQKK